MGSAARPPQPAPVNDGKLWAVRIAALLGPVILSVFVILWAQALGKDLSRRACSPPSRWLSDGTHIAGLSLAIAASLPACFFVLWKLAGPEQERGLAVARITGWMALVCSGLVFGLLSLNFVPPLGEAGLLFLPVVEIYLGVEELLGIPDRLSLSLSLTTVLVGLLVLSQWLLVAVVSKARAARGRGRGDSATSGSTRNAAEGLVLFVLLFHVGMTLMNQPVPRDPQLDRIRSVLTHIRESETTYASTFQQGYSAYLSALGPPPGGTDPSPIGAGLLDYDLSFGKAEGYSFVYGNLRWSDGKQLYMVSAQPASNCQGPCFCSFLLDYSGNINEIPKPRAKLGIIQAKKEPLPTWVRNPARLVVETVPGAQVFVEEVFRGHAGPDGRLEIGYLRPAYQTVLVILPDSRYFEQRLDLPAGRETTVVATQGKPIKK